MCPPFYGFLALFVPSLFLCVPLYMRYYALRPHLFTMSPTDMKLLNQVSRFSFNAYLFEEKKVEEELGNASSEALLKGNPISSTTFARSGSIENPLTWRIRF